MERVAGEQRHRFEPWHLALAGWVVLGPAAGFTLPGSGDLAALMVVWLMVPLLAAIPFAARPPGDLLRGLGWMYLVWVSVALTVVASIAVAGTSLAGVTLRTFAATVWALDLVFLLIPGFTVVGIGLSTWRSPRAALGVELARAVIVGSFVGAVPALVVAALSLGLVVATGELAPGQLVVPLPLAAGGSALLLASGLAFWWRTHRAPR